MSAMYETPPSLSGTAESQLAVLGSYLFRLSEQLNMAAQQLDDRIVVMAKEASASSKKETDTAMDSARQQAKSLKSLIVSTAEIVSEESTKLYTELNKKYEAFSTDFGSYKESAKASIEATANGIVQSYGFDALIKAAQNGVNDLKQYQVKTEGYIKSGFIDYEDDGVTPIIGIAIGQNLESTSVTVGEVKYDRFNANQNCVFLTPERLSFRIDGNEVGYFSNESLYVTSAYVGGDLILGGKWKITSTNALRVRWIG